MCGVFAYLHLIHTNNNQSTQGFLDMKDFFFHSFFLKCKKFTNLHQCEIHEGHLERKKGFHSIKIIILMPEANLHEYEVH